MTFICASVDFSGAGSSSLGVEGRILCLLLFHPSAAPSGRRFLAKTDETSRRSRNAFSPKLFIRLDARPKTRPRVCPSGKVERFLDAKRGTTMKADGWEELYAAAALETDGEKLPKRIRAARASIDARIHGLQSENGGSPAERIAICDALTGLNRLSRKLESRHNTGPSNA
jgi:hypothetical protein